MRQMYGTLVKQVEKGHPFNSDAAEHLKNVPQHKFGTKLMACVEEAKQGKLDAHHTHSTAAPAEGADARPRTQTAFELVYSKAARIQLDLGQLEANYKSSLHREVTVPVGEIVEKELEPVAKERKKLEAAAHDAKDATKKSVHQSEKANSMKAKSADAAKAKEEAAKDLMTLKATQLKAAEGVYSLALASVMDQDKRLAEPLINLIQEQLAYVCARLASARCAGVRACMCACVLRHG